MNLRRRYLTWVANAQAWLDDSRPRVAAQLRVAAGVAWLLLAILFFRGPFATVLSPAAAGKPISEILDPPPPVASGFHLRVESDPAGGVLWIDGTKRGETPIFTNVACEEGDTVELMVVKEGFSRWRKELFCRKGETISVAARLDR